MKRIGQKLSFLTKVMLVIGLLISNLSSLSVVFAYETPDDMVVTLTEKLLEISYNQELADGVKAVDVRVYENYTYSDGISEEEVSNVYSLTEEEILAGKEGTLELTYNSIFVNEDEVVNNFELFDGLYKVRVEIVDVTNYIEDTVDEVILEETTETVMEEEVIVTEEETITESENSEEQNLLTQEETTETVLAVASYEKEMLHESGLNIKLFNTDGTEIILVDGKYPVSAENSKVTVVAQILSGGLNPNDMFEYKGVKYKAHELLGVEFKSEPDFRGYLFGEYELPVEVKVNELLSVGEMGTTETFEATLTEEENSSDYQEVSFIETINILYESYELNAYGLNMIATNEGYGESYMFYSDSKDGILYVLSEIEGTDASNEETVVTRTMLDLYNILNVALEEEENVEPIITYTLLKNGVNVLESYVPSGEEDTIESYLSTIALDDTVQIILANEGLTITYDVVLAADLNNDNVITQDDVLELINQVVGEAEINDTEKSDLSGDGKVNSLDVLYLNQVVKTHIWDAEINEEEVKLNAALIAKLNDEILSEENMLTSGDEFTVDYVLSLTDYEVNGIAGLFNYDKSLFELVSLDVANEWLGNDNEGKFLYLGEESLTGPELEENETELPVEENTEEIVEESETISEEVVVTEDYVVITATFKALKSTKDESSNVIILEGIELFNSTQDSVTYYVLDKTEISTEAINVVASDDNTLSYLEVAGKEIALEDGLFEYEITVSNDVTLADLKYILGNVAANISSIVCPEELVEGENTIVITVTSETGVSQDYTIIVVREEAPEETTTQLNYNNNYEDDPNNEDEEIVVTPGETDEDEEEELEEESNLSRIIIIILILLVIAGLVYLIFKDEDDEETKKANKEINKLKKEVKEPEVKTAVNKNVDKASNKTNTTSNNKSNSKNNSSKNKKSSNNKKER